MGILELALVAVVVLVASWYVARRYVERKALALTVLDAADPPDATPVTGPLPETMVPAAQVMQSLGLTPGGARLIHQHRSGLTLVQLLGVDPEQRWWVEATGSLDPAHPPPLWAVSSLLAGGRGVLSTGTRHRLPLGEHELAQTLPAADPVGLVGAHREALVLLASRGVVPEPVRPEAAAQAADRAHHLSCQPCRDDPAGTTKRVVANQREDRDEARGKLAQQPDLGVRLAHLHAR